MVQLQKPIHMEEETKANYSLERLSKALCSQDEMERNNLLLRKDGDLGVFSRENPLLELKAGFLVES